jgi:hypothetical protein
VRQEHTVKILKILGLTAIFVVFALGEWWSREPQQFNVLEEAIKQANPSAMTKMNLIPKAEVQSMVENRPKEQSYESLSADLPVGYTYASTLSHIANTLLHKPGGYLTNDIMPPGVYLDNIPSWEFGALVMLRDAATALRNHFARDQSQI